MGKNDGAKGGANDGRSGDHAKDGGPSIGEKPNPDSQSGKPEPKHK